MPLPPTRRPRQSAEPITQRYPLRREVPPKPFPARPTASARVTDTNPSNSTARRNFINMVEPQSSSAEEPAHTGRSSQKSMPLPGSRGAPFFDKTKPIELLRFIDQMEDLFDEYGINDNQEKKKKLGKYTDQQTEFEWKAFNEFEEGKTFADFKKALIEDYPEAQMAGKGTLAALNKVCKENSRLAEGDYAELKTLTRSFRAQQKLLMAPPVLVSNRELVDMFLNCLRESFASQVRSSLNIEQSKDRKEKDKEDTATRRPEDPYDIIDVINMAETIAGRLRGNTRDQAVVTRDEPIAAHASQTLRAREQAIKIESDGLDELRNIAANFEDQVKIGQKQNTELRNFVQSTQIEMKKLFETLAQQHPGVNNPQTKHATYKMTSDGCWYCEEHGHFTMNCPHREEHINQKKIKLLGNKIYFAHNNTAVPRGNNEKSVRQIVEDTCRQVAIIQNNMFADPGEVYKQESVPGILRIPDSNNGNEFSVFTNQMRDKRDDVILNMNSQVLKLTEMLTNLIADPNKAKDVDVSQFAVTRRSQTETQGQQGK